MIVAVVVAGTACNGQQAAACLDPLPINRPEAHRLRMVSAWPLPAPSAPPAVPSAPPAQQTANYNSNRVAVAPSAPVLHMPSNSLGPVQLAAQLPVLSRVVPLSAPQAVDQSIYVDPGLHPASVHMLVLFLLFHIPFLLATSCYLLIICFNRIGHVVFVHTKMQCIALCVICAVLVRVPR